MNDFKKRIEKSMLNFHKKQLRKPRNKKNENKEGPVVLEIKNKLTTLGFSLDIVEAKAVFNRQANAFVRGQVAPGFPDLCGTGPDGESVFIEVKAPGKRSTIRPAQFDFLLAKINKNAFAICADSFQYAFDTYKNWKSLNQLDRKELLTKELPKSKKFLADNSGDLF